MIPDLMQRTGSLTLEVEPRLVTPVRALVPGREGGARSARSSTRGPVAAQEPIAGLGRHFRPNWEAFPKRERGYLVADEARTRALRAPA